jgi:sugar phosphate isomerase/epimerase
VLAALLTDSVTSDLDRAIRYALLWGLDGVVLRSLGRGERVPHVNEALVRRRLAEAELPAVAVDPGLFEAPHSATSAWLNDLATFSETASFCRRMRCGLVTTGALAGSADDAWDASEAGTALARLAREGLAAGLHVAVRNDDATACRSGRDLRDVLASARAACNSNDEQEVLGAAWNPAASMRAGVSPEADLEVLLDAGIPIHYVAVEDSSVTPNRESVEDPGQLDLGWPRQLALLALAGYEGPLVLEVRERPAGPAGLRAATALLELIRSTRRPASA